MRAAVFVGYGGPEKLVIRDVPVPSPGPRQVRVRVEAAAVNPLDWKLRRGELKLVFRIAFPFVPGAEFAGTVESAGPGSRFKNGDAVFGSADVGGAYAEYAVANDDRVAPLPSGVSPREAAGLPIAGQSALQCLRDLGRLRAGQSVLVNGAAGAIGMMAVQMTRLMNGVPTAVTSAKNVDLVQGLGAGDVIDYARDDFTALGRRWDLVLDAVPNRSYWSCRRVLSGDGAYVTTLPGPGPLAASLLLKAARLAGVRHRVGFLVLKHTPADLARLAAWAGEGRLRVPIGHEFPFDRIADAIAVSESRHTRGRIVVLNP